MRDYMKKYKIFNKLLLLFAVIFGIFGCTTSGDKGGGVQVVYHPAETKPQVVVYSKYVPVNIAETQSYSINASVIPEEEASSALVYSSSDNSIAAVSNDGNVTINKTGIAVINIALEKDSTVNNQVIINAYDTLSDEENNSTAHTTVVLPVYLRARFYSGGSRNID